MEITLAHEPLNGVVFINGVEYMPKPVPVPANAEYEIFTFLGINNSREWTLSGNGMYHEFNNSFLFPLKKMIEFVKDGTACIHSVQRRPDNEVFTVGEDETNIDGKIAKIILTDGMSIWLCSDTLKIFLKFAEKVKQPAIILETKNVKTPWTDEQIQQRLRETQEIENGYNREVSKISSQINSLNNKKNKLCKKISKNMKYQYLLLNLR